MGGGEKKRGWRQQTEETNGVFHFSAPVDRRNNPAKTCLLNKSLSLLSGCSLNGSESRAMADWGKLGVDALRLLSDTTKDCYENAFMSVQPLSAVLNMDVAHSPLSR